MKTKSEFINNLNIELKRRGYKTFCRTSNLNQGNIQIPNIQVRNLLTPVYIFESQDNQIIFTTNTPYDYYCNNDALLRVDLCNPKSLDAIYDALEFIKNITDKMLEKFPSMSLRGQ